MTRMVQRAAQSRGRTLTEFKNASPDNDLHDLVTGLADAVNDFKRSCDDRMDRLELRMNRPRVAGDPAGSAQTIDAAADALAERKAFGAYIKSGAELKGVSVGDDPAGGYLVGTAMATAINQKIFDQSPIRRLARVITLDAGDGWSEPVDFSDLGAEWVAEMASRPETDAGDVGMLNIPLNEIYASQVVSQKLLDLSSLNIGSWIEGKISDKFGRKEGLAYVSGDGVGKPKGFMAYDTATTTDATRPLWTLQHVVSGSAAAVADAEGQANGLKDLYWAVRAPYRANGTWVMASNTANAVDKLKDSNDNYIWRNGMTAGAPPELLGRPVEFDENMPAIGAGAFPIAFGDFRRGYTVVDWSGIKPLRDPFTAKPNVIFYVYRRVGGGLSNSEAIKLLKCST